MVIQHQVRGYEEFRTLAESLEGSGQTIYVFFSGGMEQQTGTSWCPYCVKGRNLKELISIQLRNNVLLTAEPVVYESLKHSNDESYFIHVDVGERDL